MYNIFFSLVRHITIIVISPTTVAGVYMRGCDGKMFFEARMGQRVPFFETAIYTGEKYRLGKV